MNIFTDNYGDFYVFWCVAFTFLGIAAVLGGIILAVRQIDFHYESNYCQPKLEQIGRQGKFVKYNFWEYDCLVKTHDGTFIPLNNLYNNVQENSVEQK